METTNLLKIEVSAKGPNLVKSECLIVYSDGREELKTGTVALCGVEYHRTNPNATAIIEV